ncbi:hypothetical protein IIA95_02265 [Patescibacteria group bacterium]|nr:hypothetical protein [Patescibacteria group bacterium]
MVRKSSYPTYTLKDALVLARTIFKENSGKPMRRLTLFDSIGKSPDSGPSRMLVTASSSYDLTEGGYQSEVLKITDRGSKIIKGDVSAKIDAVLNIPIYKAFFDHYKNTGVPSGAAAKDFLVQEGIKDEKAMNCLKILLANGKDVKLIQEASGKERIVSVEHAREKLGSLSDSSEIPEVKDPPAEPDSLQNPERIIRKIGLSALNINIQIELPGNATPEQYESIFKNMRKYLLDEYEEQK